jgi:outer membrane lipoprotein-sorting protein
MGRAPALYNKTMHRGRVVLILVLFCFVALGLSGCLARRRAISQKGGGTNKTLLVADKQTLLDSIARQFEAVRDFSAQVNMVPALGSAEKSKITEYKDILAYILFRKPNDIRLIGLYPVVRTKAFDMVSTGLDFKLYVPSRNRFLVGRNEIVHASANKLENLRPQHFLDAMMVRPVDTATEKVILENYTDEDNAFYVLHVVHENGNGQLTLARTIWFGRENLMLARQLIFDADGNILTDARYSDWKAYDNVPFPKHIEINRPRDEYAVVIDVVKMDVNKGVSQDKFVLEQPEGTTLQVVDQAGTPAPPGPTAPPAKGKKTKK